MSQTDNAEAKRPLSVPEALARILEGVTPLEGEPVSLDRAAGRTLAADLAARLTQPPFDASAMDGYAVRAVDIAELPASLRMVGRSAAGHGFSGSVGPGQAVRIFTGAPIPDGADHVVIQENVAAADESVVINESSGSNVRKRGGDFAEGQVLLGAGRRLGPREVALAAAMNHAEIPVRRRPKVAILATGDELVSPGGTPGADQIVSSIPFGLAALIEAAGGEPARLGIARDSLGSLAEHIGRALEADVLVTIGGASVGDHDLVRPALVEAGISLAFNKVAMRPGKPLLFGRKGALRVLGLAGNPVSALICARVFLVPLIHALLGRAHADDPLTAILEDPLEANGPREHYMRAKMATSPEGGVTVRSFRNQDSSLLATLADSDSLIVRAPCAPYAAAGERVTVLPLNL